jgi:hypothetical protein
MSEENLNNAATPRSVDQQQACSPNWKSIADDLAAALERLDALYRSEQDPEAPMVRPEWLRHPWQRYHRALADSANS